MNNGSVAETREWNTSIVLSNYYNNSDSYVCMAISKEQSLIGKTYHSECNQPPDNSTKRAPDSFKRSFSFVCGNLPQSADDKLICIDCIFASLTTEKPPFALVGHWPPDQRRPLMDSVAVSSYLLFALALYRQIITIVCCVPCVTVRLANQCVPLGWTCTME